MKSKNWISIHFKMGFKLPSRLRRSDRALVDRLVKAAIYMDACARLPKGAIEADVHHLADATNAIESLVSVIRRARATTTPKE